MGIFARNDGGTMESHILGRCLAATLLVSLASCTSVIDVDRFHSAAAAASSAPSDGDAGTVTQPGSVSDDKNLVFVMKAMSPHPTELFEYRVVDQNDFVQSRGLCDPLGAEDVTIHVPLAFMAQGGPYRLDFYADHNGSRSYDGIGSGVTNDHAWRLQAPIEKQPGVTVNGSDVVVTFVHNTSFTDIDTLPDGTKQKPLDTTLPATVRFVNLDAFASKLLQVRVAQNVDGHTVALYRYPRLSSAAVTATVPGAVEEGVTYTVDVYVDANGDGLYDDPASGGDYGWRMSQIATQDGLVVDFDPNALPNHSVSVGPP
jgi:hypothetical protein